MKSPSTVKVAGDGRIRCPRHGKVEAEYKQQDPAPCGCAWVWENGKLIATPSWKGKTRYDR